jgi:hypothetical protein
LCGGEVLSWRCVSIVGSEGREIEISIFAFPKNIQALSFGLILAGAVDHVLLTVQKPHAFIYFYLQI